MNDKTPTRDRILNLARPQIPCPVVQPLPSLVPNPVRNPARAYPKGERMGVFESLIVPCFERLGLTYSTNKVDVIRKEVRKTSLHCKLLS
jgi:hypothetical protein